MAWFWFFVQTARFRGTANKTPPIQPSKSPVPSTTASSAGSFTTYYTQGSQSTTGSFAPKVPPLPNSPPLAQTMGIDQPRGSMATGEEILISYQLPRPIPLWLHAGYAKHIVKGNFMTLSARPKTVEEGEWISHHVVEHYRNLWNFVRVVHDKEEDGSSICNPIKCPKTSAGANHSFTWLNSRLEPVEVPAYEYMSLMQRWISGKIEDTNVFPNDPVGVSSSLGTSIPNISLSDLSSGNEPDWVGKRSGFPRTFIDICKTIFRQMLRVYAHLYWAHFVDPFYHLHLEKQLNSCFCHFVLTATKLEMLTKIELEPMQPLIDLWAANGTFPPESKAYEYAHVAAGERLLQLANVV